MVVGSDAVGVRELIRDGDDGFVFKIGDSERLANIIESILAAPENFQSFADKARLKAQQFYDKKHVNQAYQDLLLPLVTGRVNDENHMTRDIGQPSAQAR